MKSIKKYWREWTIIIASIFIMYHTITGTFSSNNPKGMIVNEQVEFIEHNWTGFDSLSFDEAFGQMYTEYGPGHVFDWRGNIFLTKLAE